jgi:hypothetical protein
VSLARHLGIEDDLRDAAAIPEIDENERPMVAPSGDPAEKDHFLADV